MRFSLNCIQCSDKCFTRPTIHVWCKKFAHGQESVNEEEPGRRFVSTTDAAIAAADSLMRQTGVWWDKCSNKFGRYVEKRKR